MSLLRVCPWHRARIAGYAPTVALWPHWDPRLGVTELGSGVPLLSSDGEAVVVCVARRCYHMSNHQIPLQALSRLLFEERSVTFADANDEQLWRFFFRRAGMHRVDFLEVVKRGQYRRVAKGDVIYDVTQHDITLHLMIEVGGVR